MHPLENATKIDSARCKKHLFFRLLWVISRWTIQLRGLLRTGHYEVLAGTISGCQFGAVDGERGTVILIHPVQPWKHPCEMRVHHKNKASAGPTPQTSENASWNPFVTCLYSIDRASAI